ncbi:MAG: PAS domain S-box protein [Desulfobacterales bacterium]|nr:PAS domain S-box protein [Desulfobacterales bacterium]
MKANDIKRLDAISDALRCLLKGRVPDALRLSGQDDKANQVGKFVNELISEHKALFDDAQALRDANEALRNEIREGKRIRKALSASESKFRRLLENSPAVVYQFRMSPDGTFSFPFVTDAVEALSGFSAGEIIRDSSVLLDMVHPEDRESFYGAVLESAGTLAPYHESVRFLKDGEERWLEAQSTPEMMPDGSILWDGFFVDVTGKKQAAEALEESERKYRQLFDHAPAGMFEFDLQNFRFLSVNEVMCVYTGYSEEEFLSMNPLDLLTEESREKFSKRFVALTRDKIKANSAEYTMVKKSGEELSVVLNNDYIYKNGLLTGARTVAHDITRLKKAERDKLNAQKIAGEQKKLALVGKIAGKMAHDFNNILSIIMGNAELSLMDCRSGATKESLELILQQTLRGKNLTKNLVAFAKAHEPKQEFFKINEKVDLVLNLLKKDLKGIKVIREDKIGIPDLLADPGMIEHALVNLIQNAVHALSMTADPELRIGTYCRYNHICFTIEDNGCGIPPEHHKEIYEPSFTLKGSRDITGAYKAGITGTGYGMANIKKYVEQHKGDISFETGTGAGTRFTVRLPIFEKALSREEISEIRKSAAYSGKNILLVEDETDILNVQYRVLSQAPCNHRVDTAENGRDAMDLFDRNPYDFISLDYILPGKINGMDVYNHIRKTRKTIPVLFISGNIEFLESIEALKRKDGCIDHLSKPCQNKDFVSRINQLFDKTRAAPPDSQG